MRSLKYLDEGVNSIQTAIRHSKMELSYAIDLNSYGELLGKRTAASIEIIEARNHIYAQFNACAAEFIRGVAYGSH